MMGMDWQDRPNAFRYIPRRTLRKEAPARRIRHWHEYRRVFGDHGCRRQAARCMDCGTPFCQAGCPLHNQVPDWNNLIFARQWRAALDDLHSTNNFPEFTGRLCPAPCEAACTLALSGAPVSIKGIEQTLADRGWRRGWVRPQPARRKSGRAVAIIGSGPAGLACAQQLVRAGHAVTVFEKQDRIGGLLRYGIPDFRLDKAVLDRRLAQMRQEGVVFHTGAHVGKDFPAARILHGFDAVVLACGAEQPRDLNVPGRQLAGIHFAMDYLTQQNRRAAGDKIPPDIALTAAGRHVVIIGGGDTGADCVGTARRQGAASIVQIQYHERPSVRPDMLRTWPDWPDMLRTSDSHREGCTRLWGLAAKRFVGNRGRVRAVEFVRLAWRRCANGGWRSEPVPDSGQSLPADLVLLAMGYAHTAHDDLVRQLKLQLDERGNVRADAQDYRTSRDGVFSCGDMRRGQSLVVWAIREGRQAARAVDVFLGGDSTLPL